MNHGALIFSVGGTCAAFVGSLGIEWSPYASRIMLAANLLTITFAVRDARRQRRVRGWYDLTLARHNIVRDDPRPRGWSEWTRHAF